MIKLNNIIKEIRPISGGKFPEYIRGKRNSFRGNNSRDYFDYIMFISSTQGIKDAIHYYLSNANILHRFDGRDVYQMIQNSSIKNEFNKNYYEENDLEYPHEH